MQPLVTSRITLLEFNFVYTNNKFQRYTAMQQTKLDRLRSVLQLYVNNGLWICATKS